MGSISWFVKNSSGEQSDHGANGEDPTPHKTGLNRPWQCNNVGTSYAGINRIKFAGSDIHLSAATAHPGRGEV
jgi:hypothetical protein